MGRTGSDGDSVPLGERRRKSNSNPAKAAGASSTMLDTYMASVLKNSKEDYLFFKKFSHM